MISLGEPTGLRLDEDKETRGHPGFPDLRNTPSGWMKTLRSQSHVPDAFHSSLLNGRYLYGNDGQQLWVAYRRGLENLFTLPVIVEYGLYELPSDLDLKTIQPGEGQFYYKKEVTSSYHP